MLCRVPCAVPVKPSPAVLAYLYTACPQQHNAGIEHVTLPWATSTLESSYLAMQYLELNMKNFIKKERLSA